MAIDKRFEYSPAMLIRDTRPAIIRLKEWLIHKDTAFVIFGTSAIGMAFLPELADITILLCLFYAWCLSRIKTKLPLKLPKYSKLIDPNMKVGGKSGFPADGILFLGNDKNSNEELWLTNSDARTHILYLGTTGAGKTEGLKSLASNALTWGSGFIYIDGKADTDLWAAIFSLARRFGRDDDMLILNYMTGNRDGGSISNSLNPFSSGSASYLTNMMVSLMAEAGGDNAMWKDRAVSMLGALLPALTYKRDHEGMLLDVQTIRDHLQLPPIIRLSRDRNVPERIRKGLEGYLDTLPGFVGDAFDDDGNERPPTPDRPPTDLSTVRQQHGYLSMQFTRALQSLADDYGYIFKKQLADIDMVDVVLNRRILIGLIPALEKSGDEAANLGKIIAATLKGMMGSTLGSTVEGGWDSIIENKPTRAPSPFMTIFDEVGYYTAQGMAVMAAQARSLGFCLVFAAQDLPALEKRVKEEARSITANCNLKIFGKLEDPTSTKEFFENTVGESLVTETSGFAGKVGNFSRNYSDTLQSGIVSRKRASYGELKMQREGEVHLAFAEELVHANMFYAAPGKIKAMRVHRMLGVEPTKLNPLLQDPLVDELIKKLQDERWTAEKALPPASLTPEIAGLMEGFALGRKGKQNLLECGALAVAYLAPPEPDNMAESLGPGVAGVGSMGNEPAAHPLSWNSLTGNPTPAMETPASNPFGDLAKTFAAMMGGGEGAAAAAPPAIENPFAAIAPVSETAPAANPFASFAAPPAATSDNPFAAFAASMAGIGEATPPPAAAAAVDPFAALPPADPVVNAATPPDWAALAATHHQDAPLLDKEPTDIAKLLSNSASQLSSLFADGDTRGGD